MLFFLFVCLFNVNIIHLTFLLLTHTETLQIMETIEAGGRPPLPSGGVSPELRELITSCWAQNPSLRPSFEEILGALDAAAIPGSWRGVLQKANVPPRLLSDVAATR